MKQYIAWILKAFVSGVIAIAVLTAFCAIYYNVPVHTETIDGATDYAWEYNKFYARATEGFAFGTTNNEGYLNLFDYTPNSEIDILVMGSSHMEAFQVSLSESTAAILGKLLPDETVYNIGTSGHDFLVCLNNMSAAVAKYKPTRYVVLEINNLSFTNDELISALNETLPDIPSHSGGIIGMLQKNQFLRLLYTQLKGFAENSTTSEDLETVSPETAEADLTLYSQLLEKLSNTVSESGAQLIIVYQSNLSICKDGSAICSEDTELISDFSDLCQQNNVLFLDMRNHFIKRYEETHILPHGFWNTSIASGHLNKHGHETIAYAVYDLIKENT